MVQAYFTGRVPEGRARRFVPCPFGHRASILEFAALSFSVGRSAAIRRGLFTFCPLPRCWGRSRCYRLSGRSVHLFWRSTIDLDRQAIVLSPARTKNKREHIVPLSAPALAIIDAQPRRLSADGVRDLLFGYRGGSFSGWSDAKEALDARIAEANDGKPIADWRLHDLRRSCATIMADRLGVMPHTVEAILNHIGSRSGVAGIYNRARYEPEYARGSRSLGRAPDGDRRKPSG